MILKNIIIIKTIKRKLKIKITCEVKKKKLINKKKLWTSEKSLNGKQ